MRNDVELRCVCGAVRGVVEDASPKTVNRVACYCDDCQVFARFLGRDDIMDERGGTDIVQVAPSRVRIVAGEDKLRAVRLSEKGVFRAYTDCCKTPAGNALNSVRSPFIGFATRFFALQGNDLDAVVGPPRGRIWGKHAVGGCPAGVDEKVSLGILARMIGMLAKNALLGRHKPSPFWTESGEPRVVSHVLTREERATLRRNG